MSREFWAQFDSEVAAQDQQEIDAASALSSEQQQKLLGLVVEFGQDWTAIAARMGLSARDTLVEFLRVKPLALFASNKYLETAASKPEPRVQPATPYSHVDQYFLQCQMLQSFAEEPSTWLAPKRQKLNQKLAEQVLLCDFATLQAEFRALVATDNALGKVQHECLLLQSQLFSERVSMQMASASRKP